MVRLKIAVAIKVKEGGEEAKEEAREEARIDSGGWVGKKA